MGERLGRYVASATGWSRRAADAAIAAGRVTVGGQVAKLGTVVGAAADVAVDGRTVAPPPVSTYVCLHKPAGYLTTRRDPAGRPTIYDLLPPELHRLKPVGRLDADSAGLLLLTDDGRWADRLTHPRYGHEREYLVQLDRAAGPELPEQLRRGVRLSEGRAIADRAAMPTRRKLQVVIHQGWPRQVRRMVGACGYGVASLTRVRFGKLELRQLGEGEWRELTADELSQLGV